MRILLSFDLILFGIFRFIEEKSISGDSWENLFKVEGISEIEFFDSSEGLLFIIGKKKSFFGESKLLSSSVSFEFSSSFNSLVFMEIKLIPVSIEEIFSFDSFGISLLSSTFGMSFAISSEVSLNDSALLLAWENNNSVADSIYIIICEQKIYIRFMF